MIGFLTGPVTLLHFSSEAATLSLAGVVEGAQIVFPPLVSTTNLPVTAVLSSGSSEVAFALEVHGEIQQRLTSGPPHTVTFSNLSAGKYFLTAQVVSEPGVSADVSFDLRSASLQPGNDLCDLASVITNLGEMVVGTNTFASSETGEPMHAQNGGGRSLWWKWLASLNGLVTVTTAGSSFDTVLGVYTGTNVAALTPVAANDDAGSTNRSSQASFNALSGTIYFIAVDGALAPDGSVANGRVLLRVLAVAPPAVSFSAPTSGFTLVSSPLATTEVSAAVSVGDPLGLTRVEYALDGAGLARTGLLSPPYQWTLSNLLAGDYLLSVSAVNTAGLIATAQTSFSVLSSAPEIRFVDATSRVPSGFQFAVTGLKGTTYELQAAAEIPAWGQLVLWTNFDGALRFTDTNAAQADARFYRVIAP